MTIAVLIPAYQAAAHLGEVLLRLRDLTGSDRPDDILVVDDGSRDATAQVARQFGARVHTFAGNRGKGHALLAGFELLRDHDAVITLDADGQHPPECVPDFMRASAAGADLVLGTRMRAGEMPLARRFANGFSSGWATWLAGQDVSDSQCGFRLYRRSLLQATPITPGRYEVESEVVVRAARLGFRIAEVSIPTVYGEEQSQIRMFRDVPRIFGTLARLTVEGWLPPPAMRNAASHRASRAAEGSAR